MNVHLVLYSNNEPYNTSKENIIRTVYNYTNLNVIIHNYNLEKIMKCDWFSQIKDLPSIDRNGRREGYYNSWKSFIIRDVYEQMNTTDILYYVDSSRFFTDGFTENIDKLCEIAYKKGMIAGSVGDNCRNNTYGVCDNLSVWNKIIPNVDSNILNKRHVLNSWFLLKKIHKMKNL